MNEKLPEPVEKIEKPVLEKNVETSSFSEIKNKAPEVPKNGENYKSITPSIKSAIKYETDSPQEDKEFEVTENGEPDEKPETEIRENHFTSDQLQKAFSKFVDSIKAEKPRLYSTLNAQQPKIAGNNNIEITLSNRAQLDDFNKNLKQNMVNFFRNELENDNITVELIVSKHEEKNKLYTSEEKFKYLLEKNPALGKLKQQLDLDFE